MTPFETLVPWCRTTQRDTNFDCLCEQAFTERPSSLDGVSDGADDQVVVVEQH
jgi:hypothetical protein